MRCFMEASEKNELEDADVGWRRGSTSHPERRGFGGRAIDARGRTRSLRRNDGRRRAWLGRVLHEGGRTPVPLWGHRSVRPRLAGRLADGWSEGRRPIARRRMAVVVHATARRRSKCMARDPGGWQRGSRDGRDRGAHAMRAGASRAARIVAALALAIATVDVEHDRQDLVRDLGHARRSEEQHEPYEQPGPDWAHQTGRGLCTGRHGPHDPTGEVPCVQPWCSLRAQPDGRRADPRTFFALKCLSGWFVCRNPWKASSERMNGAAP